MNNLHCNCGLGGEECDFCKIGELMLVIRDLLDATDALQDLLVCYRINKRPSEALFKRIDKARKAIAAAKEKP